jgi:hypothetical protein
MTTNTRSTVARCITAASYETRDRRRLIARADALAILGKSHPARPVVDTLPCEGNHRIGYCCGVVVSTAAVLDALEASHAE